MTKEKTVKFTTFGPNRGLTLQIGNYQFTDGVCEIPEADSSSATRVLCRYYDVCQEHELEAHIKEYDRKYANSNVGDDPVINTANEEVAKRNSPRKPAAEKEKAPEENPEKAPEKPADTVEPSPEEAITGTANVDPEKEPSAKAGKKKGN
jgi:hypothetical protein